MVSRRSFHEVGRGSKYVVPNSTIFLKNEDCLHFVDLSAVLVLFKRNDNTHTIIDAMEQAIHRPVIPFHTTTPHGEQ